MAPGDEVNNDISTEPGSIQFHYIKSAYFRVVHVDGAYGGLTMRGNIHAAVYNERQPIPKRSVAKIIDDKTLGKEEVTEVKSNIVREVEVDLIFDLQSAIGFRDWLDNKIKALQKLIEDDAK